MKTEGRWVVLEGISMSGKSTQLKLLNERLLHDWVVTREPGGTGFGILMRVALQDPMYDHPISPRAQLFGYSASRAQLIEEVIMPNLRSGNNILQDRYWPSTMAYQGVGGQSRLAILIVSLLATGGLLPDRFLYYDLDPKIALQRKAGKTDLDRMDMKGIEFYGKVRQTYQILGKFFPRRWSTIDGSGDIETVYNKTVEELTRVGIIPRR